jgi:hypothetical protein
MSIPDKIMKALEDACKRGTWGQIQIDLQRGTPVLLRVTETQKLYEEENNRERFTR